MSDFPIQNFTQYEPFVITGEVEVYVFKSKSNPSSRLQFDNTTLPQRYAGSGLALWNGITINFGYCDWVTSFGAPDNTLPDDTQINTYLRSLFIAGPCCQMGILSVLPSAALGESLVNTTDSTSTVAYLKNLVAGTGIGLSHNNSQVTIDNTAPNSTIINYQVPDVDSGSGNEIAEIGNGQGTALISCSDGPPAIQIFVPTGNLQLTLGTFEIIDLTNVNGDAFMTWDTTSKMVTYSKSVDVLGIKQLTGDVTAGPGSGSQVATIAGHAVTYAKMQQASANVILCNPTGGAADYSELSVAASRLVGRGSAGNVQALTTGTGLLMGASSLGVDNTIMRRIDDIPALSAITVLAAGSGDFQSFSIAAPISSTFTTPGESLWAVWAFDNSTSSSNVSISFAGTSGTFVGVCTGRLECLVTLTNNAFPAANIFTVLATCGSLQQCFIVSLPAAGGPYTLKTHVAVATGNLSCFSATHYKV